MLNINMRIWTYSKLKAQAKRRQGYEGHNVRGVLTEIDQVIAEADRVKE